MAPTQISVFQSTWPVSGRGAAPFQQRSIHMRKMLLALFVMAAVVIGLGFYLKWFSFTPKGGEYNTNLPIAVDKEKIKSDVEKGKEKAKDLTDKGKGSGGGDNEKAKGATPASQAKEKDQ